MIVSRACGKRVRGLARLPDSSVAQWQSIRLLTGGLLVRVQPEEPIISTTYVDHLSRGRRSVGTFWDGASIPIGNDALLALVDRAAVIVVFGGVPLRLGLGGSAVARDPRRSIASRCACWLIWPYRCAILTVVEAAQPRSFPIIGSDSPCSSSPRAGGVPQVVPASSKPGLALCSVPRGLQRADLLVGLRAVNPHVEEFDRRWPRRVQWGTRHGRVRKRGTAKPTP